MLPLIDMLVLMLLSSRVVAASPLSRETLLTRCEIDIVNLYLVLWSIIELRGRQENDNTVTSDENGELGQRSIGGVVFVWVAWGMDG